VACAPLFARTSNFEPFFEPAFVMEGRWLGIHDNHIHGVHVVNRAVSDLELMSNMGPISKMLNSK